MPAKSNTKIIGMPWSFAAVWNDGVRSLPDRPLQRRDYIYASELGGSFRDRYLKMNAHKYSNPFNDRAKCKMISGMFFESIVGLVLTATGILKEKQLRGEVQLPGLLKVSGRLDFVAGGLIDWGKAKHEAEKIKHLFSFTLTEMHPFVSYMVDVILKHFQTMFTRVPIMEYVLECKSVSGFVYKLIKKSGTPRRGHPLQSLHYLLSNKDVPQALLTYISREDVMIQEFYIDRSKQLLKTYKEDVSLMTGYYELTGRDYMKNIPAPDPEIVFEEASYRFVKSNKAEYSPYLTMTYGYKNIDDFKLRWGKPLASWNRTFRRCVIGADMTKLNLNTIKEAAKIFPDWDKYVQQAKKAGAFEKPDLEEGE